MKNSLKKFFSSLVFPALAFGALTGIITAGVVMLFKWCAKYAVHFSETIYSALKNAPYFIPLAIIALFGVALLFSYCYKTRPNLRGGGIPTSIGVLRGLVPFRWLQNLIGVFLLSLITFVCGVALGTEGPSVQIGTAIGGGCMLFFSKKLKAWKRYSMTGGACAGFTVATGAPISGILFALEEAHERVSPIILIVAATSVFFSYVTASLLAPVLGVSVALIPGMNHIVLQLQDYYIPVIIAVVFGLYAVLFLRFYRLLSRVKVKRLKGIKEHYLMFGVLAVTLAVGLFSFSLVSTGHELILDLFTKRLPLYILLVIIVVRSGLTIGANCFGITGGVFLPILAIGGALSSFVAISTCEIFGLDDAYYSLIVALGIAACISSMMKMPLTAIVFAVEALSCYQNILAVIIVSVLSFAITELFGSHSINDCVLEDKLKRINQDKVNLMIETLVTVKDGAFASGKQVRDILWPANFYIISLRFASDNRLEIGAHGGRVLRSGDVLRIRYSTYNENHTEGELFAIVGEQCLDKKNIERV